MNLLGALLENGVTVGLLYGLFAYGLSLILSVTGIFHFAHGLTLAASAYAFWWTGVEQSWPVGLAIAAAVLTGAVLGLLTELIVYRPLRRLGAGEILFLVASISVLTFGQGVLALLFGPAPKATPPMAPLDWSVTVGTVSFTGWDMTVVVTSILVFVALLLVLQRTRAGLALRAAGDNPKRAESLGLRLPSIYYAVFLLGSAVAAIPAVLLTVHQPITTTMGFSLLVKAIVVLIIGGIGSMSGALAGGLLIGLTENLVQLWAPTEWSEFSVFLLLFLFVLWRPTGLRAPSAEGH